MREITFVTTNEGKFSEFSEAVHHRVKLKRANMGYPEIQTDRLEDVVIFALKWLNEHIEGEVLIDDSGLFVKALNGFPGVYSHHALSTIGNEGLLKLMKGLNREAMFCTVIGYSGSAGNYLFRGECPGRIAHEQSGEKGFGFDSVFVPEGYNITFAQMSTSQKNEISHRGRAIRAFLNYLEKVEGGTQHARED